MAGAITPTYDPNKQFSLTATTPYQESMAAFPTTDPFKSKTLTDILSRGESAGLQAKNQAIQKLSSMGFGKSTFGEALGSQAQAQARTPYVQQAIAASEAIKQQEVQNRMNMLQQALAAQQAQTQRDQFSTNLQSQQQQFAENVRQFGLQYALAKRKQDIEEEAQRRKQQSSGLFGALAGGIPFASGLLNLIPGVGTALSTALNMYGAGSAIQQGLSGGGYEGFNKLGAKE